MTTEPRPTSAERADAAERLADAIEEVHAAMRRAWGILRERAVRGSYSFPLFSNGAAIDIHLGKAREELWAAGKFIAVQGFEERRRAAREAFVIDGVTG